MPATIATPINPIELTPGSTMQINDLSWENCLTLLDPLGDGRSSRIAYDHRVLEIRIPGQPHAAINRVLAVIALTLAEEFGFEFNDLGSMPMNRADLRQGVEPDSCFYIQKAQAGQGWGREIPAELPPDLALEVDIANRSESNPKLYPAMQVPEVWLYQRDGISLRWLEAGAYREATHSWAFPAISTTQLDEWLQLRKTGTDLTVVRAVRQFCRNLNG